MDRNRNREIRRAGSNNYILSAENLTLLCFCENLKFIFSFVTARTNKQSKQMINQIILANLKNSLFTITTAQVKTSLKMSDNLFTVIEENSTNVYQRQQPYLKALTTVVLGGQEHGKSRPSCVGGQRKFQELRFLETKRQKTKRQKTKRQKTGAIVAGHSDRRGLTKEGATKPIFVVTPNRQDSSRRGPGTEGATKLISVPTPSQSGRETGCVDGQSDVAAASLKATKKPAKPTKTLVLDQGSSRSSSRSMASVATDST